MEEDDVAEHTAERGSLGFMFILVVLSFADAKPRKQSLLLFSSQGISTTDAIALNKSGAIVARNQLPGLLTLVYPVDDSAAPAWVGIPETPPVGSGSWTEITTDVGLRQTVRRVGRLQLRFLNQFVYQLADGSFVFIGARLQENEPHLQAAIAHVDVGLNLCQSYVIGSDGYMRAANVWAAAWDQEDREFVVATTVASHSFIASKIHRQLQKTYEHEAKMHDTEAAVERRLR